MYTLHVTQYIYLSEHTYCEMCVAKQVPKEYCIRMIYECYGIHHSDIYILSTVCRGHNFATVSNISPSRILTFCLRHCHLQPMRNCLKTEVRCLPCQHRACAMLKWYHYTKINSAGLRECLPFHFAASHSHLSVVECPGDLLLFAGLNVRHLNSATLLSI